ncbi:hypothetical protein M758_UG107000 [Ceratodon purpureus]|nr:hypothetical protein M758_UG107000 [Ceratodon purpureus]
MMLNPVRLLIAYLQSSLAECFQLETVTATCTYFHFSISPFGTIVYIYFIDE